MSDLKTPCVPISKIDVEEGFNARIHMDEKELEGLAASLGTAGVVQPLSVRPGKGGRFTLVAGHRRFAAAKQATRARGRHRLPGGAGPSQTSMRSLGAGRTRSRPRRKGTGARRASRAKF